MTDQDLLNKTFLLLQFTNQVASRKDFADKIGVDYSNLTNAFNGKKRYLNGTLFTKIENVFPGAQAKVLDQLAEYTVPAPSAESVRLLPQKARGGAIGSFAQGVMDYECEKIVSPIRGVDFAMQVTGDSMSPEYPSGSIVLIKKIDESAFVQWGEVYVLDTVNGPVIKRVQRTADPDLVLCSSINQSFQSFTVCIKDIIGWYKVLMVMTAK